MKKTDGPAALTGAAGPSVDKGFGDEMRGPERGKGSEGRTGPATRRKDQSRGKGALGRVTGAARRARSSRARRAAAVRFEWVMVVRSNVLAVLMVSLIHI